jgi:hypothetical protein
MLKVVLLLEGNSNKGNQKKELKRLEYYLLDLERTLGLGKPYYWKRTLHGYTDNIQFAGMFSKHEAEIIVQKDLDKRTVMVHHKVVEKTMLLTDMKAKEST